VAFLCLSLTLKTLN